MEFNRYKQEYQALFRDCQVLTDKAAIAGRLVNKLIIYKPRYETVSRETRVPWYFIGILHCMESSMNFERHLHNGDALTSRTIHVPKGRPLAGRPPFTWETSAIDALTYQRFNTWNDWDIAGMLYCFERYNGLGYRRLDIHSPYLWSFSNHYTKGKFSSDGVFDPEAVSGQCGAAVLLKLLLQKESL